MNDHILLGFRNDKTLVNERIASESEFPVEVLSGENEHVSVVFTCGDNKRMFDSYLTALADYIINQYELKLLNRLIRKNYEKAKPFHVREMLRHLPELEQDTRLGRESRRRAVADGLRSYFEENSSASVEGLVTFRLREYQALLTHVADRLMDLYLAQKEYEEFVSLLRYFVNVQSGRPRLSHLIVHADGTYSVLNEDKKNITQDCLSDFVLPGELINNNFDDLLISILITLAPERLIVHNGQLIQNAELFKTIGKVFDKIEYCAGCELCEKIVDVKK